VVPVQGAVTQSSIVGQVYRFGTIDSDNSNLSWLTSGAAQDNAVFGMSVSPNGAWLAYTDSTWDLRVLRTDDSGSRLVKHLGLGAGGGADGDGIGWRANP
jgi:hypothetical protein